MDHIFLLRVCIFHVDCSLSTPDLKLNIATKKKSDNNFFNKVFTAVYSLELIIILPNFTSRQQQIDDGHTTAPSLPFTSEDEKSIKTNAENQVPNMYVYFTLCLVDNCLNF